MGLLKFLWKQWGEPVTLWAHFRNISVSPKWYNDGTFPIEVLDMREAKVNGRLVSAGPDAPAEAVCPSCGEVVRKRRRRKSDGQVTYFYRHVIGVGDECPLRYRPVA